MSDMTITAEERTAIRKHFDRECTDPSQEVGYWRIKALRLLDALEMTESLLDDSDQETRANFSAVYQCCTKIIPDLKAKIKAAEARAEEAEAEDVKLQKDAKMVDWLARQLHGLGPRYDDAICPHDTCRYTYDCIECWKEAARRAVEGEPS